MSHGLGKAIQEGPDDRAHTGMPSMRGVADAVFIVGRLKNKAIPVAEPVLICMASAVSIGAPTGPLAGDADSAFWVTCGCLGRPPILAVVPLTALMGLLASSVATLTESAKDSFSFPGRATLGLRSPGDGFADPGTCYQQQARVSSLKR